MTERDAGRAAPGHGPGRRGEARGRARPVLVHRLAMVAWLWLLWLILWGSGAALVVTGGLLAAVGIVAAFRMPPVRARVRPRPLRLLRLAARLLVDVAGSAVAVGWAAVRDGRRVRSAVVEVPLSTDEDLLVTAVSLVTTMTPGTLVLEIDRGRRLLYVHLLPVPRPEVAERRRAVVRLAERGVVGALDGAAVGRPGDPAGARHGPGAGERPEGRPEERPGERPGEPPGERSEERSEERGER